MVKSLSRLIAINYSWYMILSQLALLHIFSNEQMFTSSHLVPQTFHHVTEIQNASLQHCYSLLVRAHSTVKFRLHELLKIKWSYCDSDSSQIIMITNFLSWYVYNRYYCSALVQTCKNIIVCLSLRATSGAIKVIHGIIISQNSISGDERADTW